MLRSGGQRPTSCESRGIAQRQQVIRIDEETPQNGLRAAINAMMEMVDAAIPSDQAKGVLAPEFNAYARPGTQSRFPQEEIAARRGRRFRSQFQMRC